MDIIDQMQYLLFLNVAYFVDNIAQLIDRHFKRFEKRVFKGDQNS